MSTDSTELTFVRCPSCRSLVPAISSRCRMCGATLDASSAAPTETSEAEPRKSGRVRQRTMSDQNPEFKAAMEEVRTDPVAAEPDTIQVSDASADPVSDSGAEDPLSAYIEEVELEDEPASNGTGEVSLNSEESESDPIFDEPVLENKPAEAQTVTAVPVEKQSPPVEEKQAPKVVVESGPRRPGQASGLSFGRSQEADAPRDERSKVEAKPQHNDRNQSRSQEPREERQEHRNRDRGDRGREEQRDARAGQQNQQQRHERQQDNRREDRRNQDQPRHDQSRNDQQRSDQRHDHQRNAQQQHGNDRRQNEPRQESRREERPQQQARENRPSPQPAAPAHAAPSMSSAQVAGSQKGRLFGWMVSFADANGKAIELREGKFFISGKSVKESDLVIDDRSISAPHALVMISRDEGMTVQDLMSERGVFVRRGANAQYTREEETCSIGHGDWVRFGDVEFLVSLLPSGR